MVASPSSRLSFGGVISFGHFLEEPRLVLARSTHAAGLSQAPPPSKEKTHCVPWRRHVGWEAARGQAVVTLYKEAWAVGCKTPLVTTCPPSKGV